MHIKKSFNARDGEWNSGFCMKFKNEYSISVQFGVSNYCDRGETTAEIAVFSPVGEFIHFRGDDVIGHITSDTVATIIGLVAGCTGDDSKLRESIQGVCDKDWEES